jgi:hypothetical protein
MYLEVLSSSLGRETCYSHICRFSLSFSMQRFYSVATLPSKYHSATYNLTEWLRIEINNHWHHFPEGRHLDPHRCEHLICHKFSNPPFLFSHFVATKPWKCLGTWYRKLVLTEAVVDEESDCGKVEVKLSVMSWCACTQWVEPPNLVTNNNWQQQQPPGCIEPLARQPAWAIALVPRCQCYGVQASKAGVPVPCSVVCRRSKLVFRYPTDLSRKETHTGRNRMCWQ